MANSLTAKTVAHAVEERRSRPSRPTAPSGIVTLRPSRPISFIGMGTPCSAPAALSDGRPAPAIVRRRFVAAVDR